MNEAESALANGMLQIAIQRMVKEHPFHAHLLSPDSLVCNPGVRTMGVTICNGRIQFPYAPEFVLRCSYDELIGVFQHEVNHLLFGHVLAGPEEYPDAQARIIAAEVTVNEWVVAPLPGRPLTLEQFPALKPLENTKTRYAYLARKTADKARKMGPAGRKRSLRDQNLGLLHRNLARLGPNLRQFLLEWTTSRRWTTTTFGEKPARTLYSESWSLRRRSMRPVRPWTIPSGKLYPANSSRESKN